MTLKEQTNLQETNRDPVEPGEHFRLTGTLKVRELEQEYREQRLHESMSSATVLIAITVAGTLFFIPSDYHLFGSGFPFPIILGLRFGICLLSWLIWKRLRAAVNSEQPARFDGALLIWSGIMAMSQVYVSFTRPPIYAGHFLVHLFTVLLTYCVVPLPLVLQAVPAVLMSIGMVLCMILKPPADGLTIVAVVATLLSGNVLGVCISRQLHHSGRAQFLALRRERNARLRLETVLSELKTLRGIIPICAHCKHIRDDAGSWHQLEIYISNHSDAEFSHGICPHCVEKYFKSKLRNPRRVDG